MAVQPPHHSPLDLFPTPISAGHWVNMPNSEIFHKQALTSVFIPTKILTFEEKM